ncbi:zeta toxin family protein [Cupriavidus pauculus]|uniref:zeta toxin family protein n=1 Tax=Cupriavidus pauculus TaxID=82633 RepID=UPI003857DFB9
MSQLWAVAGPNGSGKTTFTQKYFAGKLIIVNPDEIANVEQVSNLQAGKLTLARQRELLEQGKSFAFETTLSGRHELQLMEDAKRKGYKVNLVFFSLDTPDLNIGRIAVRVEDGGHNVPTADVLRRYQRSLENLPTALGIADRAYVLDNSGTRARLLLSMEKGQVKRLSRDLPEWAKPALNAYKSRGRVVDR